MEIFCEWHYRATTLEEILERRERDKEIDRIMKSPEYKKRLAEIKESHRELDEDMANALNISPEIMNTPFGPIRGKW